jgi:hypothetical protein
MCEQGLPGAQFALVHEVDDEHAEWVKA